MSALDEEAEITGTVKRTFLPIYCSSNRLSIQASTRCRAAFGVRCFGWLGDSRRQHYFGLDQGLDLILGCRVSRSQA